MSTFTYKIEDGSPYGETILHKNEMGISTPVIFIRHPFLHFDRDMEKLDSDWKTACAHGMIQPHTQGSAESLALQNRIKEYRTKVEKSKSSRKYTTSVLKDLTKALTNPAPKTKDQLESDLSFQKNRANHVQVYAETNYSYDPESHGVHKTQEYDFTKLTIFRATTDNTDEELCSLYIHDQNLDLLLSNADKLNKQENQLLSLAKSFLRPQKRERTPDEAIQSIIGNLVNYRAAHSLAQVRTLLDDIKNNDPGPTSE